MLIMEEAYRKRNYEGKRYNTPRSEAVSFPEMKTERVVIRQESLMT